MPACECGCGIVVADHRRFVKGHHSRLPDVRAKLSTAKRGKSRPPFSVEWRAKLGDVSRGKRKVFRDPVGRRNRIAAAALQDLARSERTRMLWAGRTAAEKSVLAEKIRESLRGRKANENQLRGLAIGHDLMRGESHWNWKGGTGRAYPKEFRHLRPLILERDGFRCIKCSDDDSLVVHHIDGTKTHNCWLNLVTLCDGCNHRAEAKALREQWRIDLRVYTCSLLAEKSNQCAVASCVPF